MLPTAVFQGDPLDCAIRMVGTTLIWGRCSGVVVECEAYLTENDEACHTFSRASTRSFVERNGPGAIYIYLNYGIHWMLNVLVKGGPRSGLILVRAIEPRLGIASMQRRRGTDDVRRLCSGPGKLTQALDITHRHHELSMCFSSRRCLVEAKQTAKVIASPRIGITRSADLPWRFTLENSPFVSVPVKNDANQMITATLG
ncbi:MAG: DNA-3-methyladenine glycosylase [Chthoniobacterales bacterium]